MVEKIKPNASVKPTYEYDGELDRYFVFYSCPKCGKQLYEDEIACDECGIFFDWKQKAHIEVRREIVWE